MNWRVDSNLALCSWMRMSQEEQRTLRIFWHWFLAVTVITSGIFLSSCAQTHPVTHLYLCTESQVRPLPWPWAVPIFKACLVKTKQAGKLPLKSSLWKSVNFFSILATHRVGADWFRMFQSLWNVEVATSWQIDQLFDYAIYPPSALTILNDNIYS